jgi:hypothetical protein
MIHRFITPLLVLILISTGFIIADQTDDAIAQGLSTIKPEEAYALCKTMALPKFAGRFTGHEGYTAAAKWAAGLFKKWGLKPISPETSYLQPYPSPYVIINASEMTLFPARGPKQIKLTPVRDFLPLFFSGSGDLTTELVFCGWGIHAPDLGYDDYAGVDVKGKYVLCFRGVPDAAGARFQKHDHHRYRMQTAMEMGAAGLIYIYDEVGANPNGDYTPGFMPGEISIQTADKVLKEKGITAADLRNDLRTYLRPISFPMKSRLHFKVDATPYPDGVGYNVAGYVEGSDKALRKEVIVIGGHFDHCGMHMGLLYPGADDNASGSATVMEMAEAFAKTKKKPKRSVVFVLFGGEEMGLQGSTYFSEHLPGMFDSMAGMFNFDMTGEGDGAWAGYSADPPELKTVLNKAAEKIKILRGARAMRGVGVRGSDFAPFYQIGVPVISIGSTGPHLAYHQPGDTIYRINPEIMADIAKLAFIAAYLWADR